jgi:hypothetical protein
MAGCTQADQVRQTVRITAAATGEVVHLLALTAAPCVDRMLAPSRAPYPHLLPRFRVHSVTLTATVRL